MGESSDKSDKMSGTKLKVPTIEGKSYAQYKLELEVWSVNTDVPEKNRGSTVALSLPEQGHNNIRAKIFNKLTAAELCEKSGYRKVINLLDEYLKADDLEEAWNSFEQFLDFSRNQQSMSQFIAEFDDKVNSLEKHEVKLPQIVLAFMLLRNAKINKNETLLILTGVDYSKKNNLYEQAKTSLKKFKGGKMCTSGADSESDVAVKLEPAWIAGASMEEAYAVNYQGRYKAGPHGGRGYYGRGGQRRGSPWNSPHNSPWNSPQSSPPRPRGGALSKSGTSRPVNPKDENGEPLTCHGCGSFRHMLPDCPHSWENMKSEIYAEEERVVLFTGCNRQESELLNKETQMCAVLDSACTATVCGKQWFDGYVESMSENDRSLLEVSPGKKIFKFGGDEVLKSMKCVILPCRLAGNDVFIRTDVVSSEIPLLLSMETMKKANVKLDLQNDEAEIMGKRIALNHTSSGHYCVPISKTEVKVETENKDENTGIKTADEESEEKDCAVETEMIQSGAENDIVPKEKCAILKTDESIKYVVDNGDQWHHGTVLGRAAKAIEQDKHFYNIRDIDTGESKSIECHKFKQPVVMDLVRANKNIVKLNVSIVGIVDNKLVVDVLHSNKKEAFKYLILKLLQTGTHIYHCKLESLM